MSLIFDLGLDFDTSLSCNCHYLSPDEEKWMMIFWAQTQWGKIFLEAVAYLKKIFVDVVSLRILDLSWKRFCRKIRVQLGLGMHIFGTRKNLSNSKFVQLNPIPTRLCHVIWYCGGKSYPCLVGIGLILWGQNHKNSHINPCISNIFGPT